MATDTQDDFDLIKALEKAARADSNGRDSEITVGENFLSIASTVEDPTHPLQGSQPTGRTWLSRSPTGGEGRYLLHADF